LAALDPSDKTAQSELAQYLCSGGETLTDPEDWHEAVTYLRKALPMFEGLLRDEPSNGVIQLYIALTEADLGAYLAMRTSIQDSILLLRRGFFDITKLVERDPRNTTHFLELLKVQRMLVDSLARTGKAQESLALANDLIAKARSVVNQAGRGEEMARSGADLELPRAYTAMADTCLLLRKRDEARKWYRLALTEWETMRSAGFVSSPDLEEEMEQARKGAEQEVRGPLRRKDKAP
jgi:tetratricopeptide (TPR) repeat protein